MIKMFLVLLSFVFATIFFVAVDGLVLFYYWEWFLVPHGIVEINIVYAIAFAVLIRHFACDYQPARKGESQFGKAVDYLILKPFFALGLGYALSLLVKLI